jgi:hypothetical protein
VGREKTSAFHMLFTRTWGPHPTHSGPHSSHSMDIKCAHFLFLFVVSPDRSWVWQGTFGLPSPKGSRVWSTGGYEGIGVLPTSKWFGDVREKRRKGMRKVCSRMPDAQLG